MKSVKRAFLIVAAVLALSCVTALPSAAQSNDIDALNKKITELSQEKKYAEAIPLAQRVLEIRERTLARDHPDIAAALMTLAGLYRAQGRNTDAETLEQRAQTMQLAAARGAKEDAARKARDEAARNPPSPQRESSNSKPPPAPPLVTSQPSGPPRDLGFQSRGGRQITVTPNSPNTPPSAAKTLPDFPWPPPKASTFYVLPGDLFQNRKTVGDVATTIVSALERTGYVERSFFRTQADGVALVTRLERINDDGTARAEGERWPTALQNYQSASDLMNFFRGLFYVDRGRYRIIVFVLQDLPFVQSSGGITGQEARAWLREGAFVLPRDVANRPFGDANCSVLIYEFASDGTAVRAVESRLTGKQHLEKAGVLSYLEKAN